MKILLFFTLLSFSTLSFAQSNFKATPLEFTVENNVYEIPNKTASEIYSKTKVWITKNYPNPTRFTISDAQDMLLKVKYYFEIPLQKDKVKIKYHLTFEMKDNKVKVTIDDLKKSSGGNNYENYFDKNGNVKNKERSISEIKEIETFVNNYIDNYVDFMNGNEDW